MFNVRFTKVICREVEDETGTPGEPEAVVFCETELPFPPFPGLGFYSKAQMDVGELAAVTWDADTQMFICTTLPDFVPLGDPQGEVRTLAGWYVEHGWQLHTGS
jgi:hypothetical protein